MAAEMQSFAHRTPKVRTVSQQVLRILNVHSKGVKKLPWFYAYSVTAFVFYENNYWVFCKAFILKLWLPIKYGILISQKVLAVELKSVYLVWICMQYFRIYSVKIMLIAGLRMLPWGRPVSKFGPWQAL